MATRGRGFYIRENGISREIDLPRTKGIGTNGRSREGMYKLRVAAASRTVSPNLEGTMAAQVFLAIAAAVDTQQGMDEFFKPQRTTGIVNFPLDLSIPFKFYFESRSSPERVPTLKYVVSARDPNAREKYFIWIQNYESASQAACRAAMTYALHSLANGRTLRQVQLDALDFM
ncbi:hypothetical protein BDY19DRAFT_989998 [Irpex rosettiformis]|uniref:Uncharacterized protein n=1 Tax=Irpex rosettiformis TaxID=378272 RepID=A0ACB8UG15_9APHY|nr:hypothetical protein BDY19DRAFT_989998 [Irpex rosettiformis]